MQRPHSQLGDHLLTRSDLATLAVRATEVFRWLAEGALEQVGDLPRGAGAPDPVFAVTSDALRGELVERLAGIGKAPVVLTPLGVRSFLLRALLMGRRAVEGGTAETDAGELVEALAPELAVRLEDACRAPAGVDADLAEHLLTTDLEAVLQEALHDVAPDVEAMLQLAAEIAASESNPRPGSPRCGPDDEQEPATEPPDVGPTEEQPEQPEVEFDYVDADTEDDDDFDACFDLDELSKLEATAPTDVAPEDAPTHREESIMTESFDAADTDSGEDQFEVRTAAELAEAEPQSFEELFAAEVEEAPAATASEERAAALDEVFAALADDLPMEPIENIDEAGAEELDGAEPVAEVVTEACDEGEPAAEPTAESDAPTPDAESAIEPAAENAADAPPLDEGTGAVAPSGSIEDAASVADEATVALAEPADEPSVVEALDEEAAEGAPESSTTAHDPIEQAPEGADERTAHEPEQIAEEPETVNESQTEPEALIDEAMATTDEPAGQSTEEPAAIVESELPETAGSEPAFDEQLVDAVAEAVEAQVAAANEPTGDEFALTSQAMDKVQDFLGELRSALVEMAQRPQPENTPSIDVAPLIQAVQAGFDRSAEQATQASSALASLAERVGQFGQQVEASVQQSVKALAAQQQHLQEAHANAPVAVVDRPRFVVQRPDRQTLVLGAVAILVVCWSILFWFKTGSPRLAFGTLIAANLVGCCLLVARRD